MQVSRELLNLLTVSGISLFGFSSLFYVTESDHVILANQGGEVDTKDQVTDNGVFLEGALLVHANAHLNPGFGFQQWDSLQLVVVTSICAKHIPFSILNLIANSITEQTGALVLRKREKYFSYISP